MRTLMEVFKSRKEAYSAHRQLAAMGVEAKVRVRCDGVFEVYYQVEEDPTGDLFDEKKEQAPPSSGDKAKAQK